MDTLMFLGFNADAELDTFSLASAARRSSADVKLRLFNASTTYTARGVTLHFTGTDFSEWFISTDGETFTGTLTVGDLSPYTSTGPIWLRRITPSTASLGPHTCTLQATATSWTTN